MRTNATTTTRTQHNGRLAAVCRAVLRSGNITRITDSENHIRKNEYTRKGYAVVVKPLKRQQPRSDLDDRITKQTDGNNNVTQYQYGNATSAFNRLLVQIIYPTLSQTLQYDNRDRITQTVDSATGSALALDGSATQTTKQSYDAASNLTAITDPANRSTGTAYNAFGQVTQTTDASTGSAPQLKGLGSNWFLKPTTNETMREQTPIKN
jgi:YD repeat-containing protein